ncbi:MAG: phospholipid carrier-dependent glycosyltransferase [Schumannella sp.]
MERTGSRLDDAWTRLMTRPGARTAWEYGAPGAVLAVASVLRLAGLGHPHELVFDETYYVKDSYTLMHLGYEAAWPPDANAAFNAGSPDIYLTDPSFVAHPPVGKWIIAAGLAVFGADDAVGWRVSVAIAGILLVLLTMLVAKRLFDGTLPAVLAGGLIAIDGNAIVMSRVALLDTMLALFALAGAYAILRDRDGNRERISAWLSWRSGAGLPSAWGPSLWARPWLVMAGVAFGLASGVKWSGLYFLAVFAVYALGSEALARRGLGIRTWLAGSLLKQGPATFLLTVPVALTVYLVSWTGWFATDGGYYRHWIESGQGQPWTGALAWVPYDLQNWWHYQATIYGYHIGEHTPHSYQANPLTWLLLVRPTSMWWLADGNNASTILDIANPLIWWAGTAALVYVAVRMLRRPNRVDAFILVGIAAGYLPWLMYLNRTVFQFYDRLRALPHPRAHRRAAADPGLSGRPGSRRVTGIRLVGAFLALCLVLSAFFLPVWTGMEIPRWFMYAHFWFRSWI